MHCCITMVHLKRMRLKHLVSMYKGCNFVIQTSKTVYMNNNPSTNGIRSTFEDYTDNTPCGLETERRVRTNTPAPSTPSPKGYA